MRGLSWCLEIFWSRSSDRGSIDRGVVRRGKGLETDSVWNVSLMPADPQSAGTPRVASSPVVAMFRTVPFVRGQTWMADAGRCFRARVAWESLRSYSGRCEAAVGGLWVWRRGHGPCQAPMP